MMWCGVWPASFLASVWHSPQTCADPNGKGRPRLGIGARAKDDTRATPRHPSPLVPLACRRRTPGMSEGAKPSEEGESRPCPGGAAP
eukprot:13830099-Alexandrium_andersonii.AAC.1